MAREDEIISFVKDRFGPVLDLNERPRELIDIIRRFAGDIVRVDPPDGGSPPGGTPPAPKPSPGPSPEPPAPKPSPEPPGPSGMEFDPTNGELMKEILRVSQQVAALQKRLGPA
jgi:hypothetical protein